MSVWRLAPRRELVRPLDPYSTRIGQTIRFLYGVHGNYITLLVTHKTSKQLKGVIQCGELRDKIRDFELHEIVSNTEVFASSMLKSLLEQAKTASWDDADNVRSADTGVHRPQLHFIVPVDEPCKRK